MARFLFAAWQVYAVMQGASSIVLDFTLFDVTQLGEDLRLRLRPVQVAGAP